MGKISICVGQRLKERSEKKWKDQAVKTREKKARYHKHLNGDGKKKRHRIRDRGATLPALEGGGVGRLKMKLPLFLWGRKKTRENSYNAPFQPHLKNKGAGNLSWSCREETGDIGAARELRGKDYNEKSCGLRGCKLKDRSKLVNYPKEGKKGNPSVSEISGRAILRGLERLTEERGGREKKKENGV